MRCEPLDLAGTFAEAKVRAVERFEAAYLEALMRRCGGNLSKASRQAGMARNWLRELLKKHGLYNPGDTFSSEIGWEGSGDEGAEIALHRAL